MDKIENKNIKNFSKGVVHGLQASAFFSSKDLYYALIYLWKEKGNFEFYLGEYKGCFYSKKSGLKKEGKGLFEYIISLEGEFKKLYLKLSPRLRGMEYGDGKEWKLNERQGEGVTVSIKSSYLYPNDIEHLFLVIFKHLDLERFYGAWNKDETYFISLENYIRYHERKERELIKVLEDIWLLIGLTEEYQGEHKIDKKKEGYKFAKVVTDKWNVLGFENKGLFFFIKSYRGEKFPEIKDEILKHPKLEIGLDAYYNKGNRPKWNAWKWILELENEIRGNVAIWSGVTIADLIEDEMFKIQHNETEVKEWKPDKLKRYYMERAKEIHPEILDNATKRKFIYLLCGKGILDTKELMRELGLSRRWIFKLIAYFEKKGIIRRIPSSRTLIEFVNPILEKHFKEKIELINNLSSFDEKETEKSYKRHIFLSEEIFEDLKTLKEELGMSWDEFFVWLLSRVKDPV